MKTIKILFYTALTALLLIPCHFALADSALILPADTEIIEAEAFLGDSSVTQVQLPDGLLRIGSKAFSGTSLTEVSLPDSLEEIADDAFDGLTQLTVTANKGTYAYAWACQHGYITPEKVLINGKESLDWQLSTGHEKTETFTVSSDLEVSISANGADWLTIETAPDGKTLTVAVSQFESPSAAERTSVITVSDGITQATLTVLQSSIMGSPIIPDFSSDETSPTLVPEGKVTVPITRTNPGAYIGYALYKEDPDKDEMAFVKAFRHEHADTEKITVNDGDAFAGAAGTLYRFDFYECTPSFATLIQSDTDYITSIYVQFTEKENKVLINNQASVKWNLVEGLEKTETFTVTSDLPCTAASDSDWLTCELDENTLTVTAAEFSSAEAIDRTGTITVTDGTLEAVLTVQQASITRAPTVVSNLSTDINNPTLVPEGTVTVEVERGQANSYLSYHVYQITQEGRVFKNGSSYLTNTSNTVIANDKKAFAEEAGNVFEIVIYENAECFRSLSVPRTLGAKVYVKFYAPILIDQKEEAEWKLSEGTEASKAFTVTSRLEFSASSDSDWLTYVLNDDGTLTVTAAEFSSTEAEERTGVITLTNGSVSAHLTVLQSSITKAPEITNLSIDREHPTELPENRFALRLKRSHEGSYIGFSLYLLTDSGSVLVKNAHFYTSAPTTSSFWVNDGNYFAGKAGNIYRLDVFELTDSFKVSTIQTIVSSAYVRITEPEVQAASVTEVEKAMHFPETDEEIAEEPTEEWTPEAPSAESIPAVPSEAVLEEPAEEYLPGFDEIADDPIL